MSNIYGKMMDTTFKKYYKRFIELNAVSKENAVTKEVLFPKGHSVIDDDRMHKMLSDGIVKRVGFNRYWLDEKRAYDPNVVLKQRLIVVALGIGFGVLLVIARKHGIIA